MNRKDFSHEEVYRPQYHFTAEANWLNDPNGLVYYEGEYHLFYQHNPYEPVWGPIHWGHAVSQDLIHWEHLPFALKPDNLGYIFSGSVVVDRNDSSGFFDGGSGLVAVYTSAKKRSDKNYLQRQSIAFSEDRGRSWVKYGGNPVIENPGLRNFRDPNVFWHDPTEKWVMVVSSQSGVKFYGSYDLKDWKLLGEFDGGVGSHEGVWECPDIFKLPVVGDEAKWVLTVGDVFGGPAGGSRMQYFVGEFDGSNFKPDSSSRKTAWVDYGQDFYAARTWNNLPGDRRLWIGWMSNLHYQEDIPTHGWRGAMSIPRKLALKKVETGYRLVQQPLLELEHLRGESRRWKEFKVSKESNFSPEITDRSLEIKLKAVPGTGKEFGFKLRKSNGQETTVGYCVEDSKLFVDRTHSGETNFNESYLGRHEAQMEQEDRMVRMRIFLDSSSVEVFGNGGKKVISDLIFPDADGEEIELYVKEGEVRVSNLEIYKLNSIWS